MRLNTLAAMAAIGAANSPTADQPTPPAHAGSFKRNPCGECWHFQRNPRGGLDVGQCMFGPPTSYPVMGKDGRPVGNMLMRPTLTVTHEGCDQWDDTDGFEDDGEPGEPARIAAVG